jgi:membrane associated rhomboid family serine protease
MFLLIPIGVDYNARRYPVVTLTLIGINTAVYLVSFAYVLSGGAEARADLYSHYWLIPKLSLWHTYVTTWFVHAGLFHLLGNMIYLYLFGACVEDMIGRWQFVLLYCLGGLAADFAWIASAPGHFESILPLGGASGAITACIGGFLVLLHSAKLNFRWVFFFLRVWTDDFWISSSPVIALWFLSDLFFMLMGLGVKSSPGGVAFGAHVGGFVAGVAVAFLFKQINRGRDAVELEEEFVDVGVPAHGVSGPSSPDETPSILLHQDGAQIGPFSAAQVAEMRRLGSIPVETLYWQEGMEEWRPLSELLG